MTPLPLAEAPDRARRLLAAMSPRKRRQRRGQLVVREIAAVLGLEQDRVIELLRSGAIPGRRRGRTGPWVAMVRDLEVYVGRRPRPVAATFAVPRGPLP